MSKNHYFIDKGTPRDLAYDAGVKLEEKINARLKTTNANRISVVFVPTTRDRLYQSLVTGRGDTIAAPITITLERQAQADFTRSDPTENVRESADFKTV